MTFIEGAVFLGLGVSGAACLTIYRYLTTPVVGELPKPSDRCRHCRQSTYSKYNKKNDDYDYYQALRAQPEVEGCMIEEPHVHMKCQLCDVEYPVQR